MYEIAAEFGCHRTTVAERLKKVGISMRGQSPTSGSSIRWCICTRLDCPSWKLGSKPDFAQTQ